MSGGQRWMYLVAVVAGGQLSGVDKDHPWGVPSNPKLFKNACDNITLDTLALPAINIFRS